MGGIDETNYSESCQQFRKEGAETLNLMNTTLKSNKKFRRFQANIILRYLQLSQPGIHLVPDPVPQEVTG